MTAEHLRKSNSAVVKSSKEFFFSFGMQAQISEMQNISTHFKVACIIPGGNRISLLHDSF